MEYNRWADCKGKYFGSILPNFTFIDRLFEMPGAKSKSIASVDRAISITYPVSFECADVRSTIGTPRRAPPSERGRDFAQHTPWPAIDEACPAVTSDSEPATHDR